ncbi:MAG: hypothetical protein ACRDHP_12815 [Ktedonobacterales bacterium]
MEVWEERRGGVRRWILLAACICLGVFVSGSLYAEYAAVLGPYLNVFDPTGLSGEAPAPADGGAWLAAKHQLRIMAPGRAGGAVVALAAAPTAFPDAALLPYTVVEQTVEPGGVGSDVAGNAYTDRNLWELCGPAAANNTLYYWNGKTNSWGTHTYTDPSNGVTTTWDNTHNRAYTLHLAWEIRPPGAPHAGMMDQHALSFGVTLYGMRDALNWEASAENGASWQRYFYTNEWWDENTPETLHVQIEADIALSGKPVVAEVDARYLPNWPPLTDQKNHYITILGYDNATGKYAYTDTCGHTTGCGSNTDGGLNEIPYSQLWQAITAIPVNRSTDPHAGDGGWVW